MAFLAIFQTHIEIAWDALAVATVLFIGSVQSVGTSQTVCWIVNGTGGTTWITGVPDDCDE